MTPTILILDDDPRRCAAMRQQLQAAFPDVAVRFEANAPDMIELLNRELCSAVLISLDHDLIPLHLEGEVALDPGTGRDVADWLAAREPVCPIIVHTTNAAAAVGMQMVLNEAVWPVETVAPYGDLDWIAEVWIELVTRWLSTA